MAESSKEDKIIRTSLESLVIFVSNDELKYREKYLPDPRHLSDDKIVCTVCSTSLASRVRKGKNIYIHSILGVLVCKKCQNFYGDGIFSTDEDGEDKYCRWCGQGGTLYLCSKCNCGFCKKCMTKNMKNTALAGIEKDDWKCLICVPRPIFGSRAVCWASQELNSTIRKKELVKLRLEEAKLKLEAENDIHTNEKECNRSSVKKDRKSTKRRLVSEDSDSSSVFIPSKKFKRDTKNDKSLNGSVKKHRRKYLSSDSDSSNIISTSNKAKGNSRNKKKHESSSSESDNVHSSKVKKHKNKNKCQSSGSESNTSHTSKELKLKYKNGGKCESSDSQDGSPSSSKKKKNKRFSKKASKTSSDESSDSDGAVDKSHSSSKKRVKSYKTKSKYKVSKRKAEAQSDPSSSESKEKLRKKKKKHIEQKSSSDVPLQDDNNVKEQHDIVLLKDNVTFDDNLETSSNSKNTLEKIEVGEDELNSVTNLLSKTGGNESANLVLVEEENTSLKKGNENSNETLTNEKQVSEIEVQINEDLTTLNNTAEPVNDETSALGPEMSLLNENDYTLSYNGSESTSDDKIPLSQDDEIKVKVDLAREWLIEVNSDIASLGNFVSDLATTKFGKRGVKLNDFDSYGDVLLTINRLKRLFEGIHTNYKNIEDGLEDKFKSWKILAGLEKSDLEDQAYDENEEIQAEDVAPTGDGERKDNINTEVDVSQFQGEDQCSLAIKVENEICSENESAMHKVNHSGELLTDVSGENNLCDETEDFTIKEEVLDIVDKETVAAEEESYLLKNSETLAETVEENETSLAQEPENEEVQTEKEEVDNDLVKVELKLRRGNSNLIWKGLLSTDDESDFYDEINLNTHRDIDDEKSASDIEQGLHLNEVEEHQVIDGEAAESNKDIDEELTKEPVNEMDAENFEALQELLYTSTEPDIGSSENDSDDSSDIQLDDSDLENILKPKQVILKKSSKKKEPKETKVIEKVNEKLESESDEVIKNQVLEEKSQEKKLEEPLDSEAEIDMLTDLTKLKKKTVLRRVEEKDDSSGQSSSEASQISDHNKDTKKRKKYNREIKKKREQERNELFGFLDGGSSAEDDADITRDDLDVMEEHYASESSESMSLEVFSRRMNEKYRELEKEQDQLNLQLLLASESEGSVGGDDFVLDSDEDKKKKGKKKKEAKSNKVDEAHVEKADTEKDDTDKDGSKKDDIDKDDSEKDDMDKDGSEKDDMDKDGSEDNEIKVKEEKEGEEAERDQDYEQLLEGMANSKTTFTGLGSSSEEDKEEDGIKEELLSDEDSKVKKQSKASDDNDEDSSNSDSSADLFLDTTKKKSEKKSWRQHKLLKIKLSDTDTSDEERWWQRRIERDKKKKQEGNSDGSEFDEFTQALSPKKPREKTKKAENGSDKENKRMEKEKRRKEEEESGSSSTLEMSSTDSSGSETFKKKKKKKNESSDSDIQIISDTDKKKKKKKKKMNLSGNSSDESGDSDDDVIDITQKNSQGESPGKGGRKNIRKVMTKHELAAATKAAAREEEERKKRIAARQKMFNEMFEIKEAEILQKLVLDFDPETKTELISVDKDLVTKMKPHQAKGVQFMWNSCFESLNQMKTKKGSGCILAHCMGLGKTFQVVSLVHTILTHKDTNVRTVLVVCPLSTVLNWYNEFDKWLEDVAGGKNIRIYHLTKFKRAHERSKQLSVWHRTGGVMILGYEMFRILANPNNKNFRLMHTEMFQKTLIDPGADLVVCDEGHMLKNESTLLSKAMSRIRTLRRIVLTGTPMQNNLKEYHCMVQFVKPNLLGTRKEFLNQFVNPITNGQFVDSTEADVKVMKRRAHVLHKMLEGLVQRFDYNVLTPFLPPKHEFVISLKLSDVQVKLYQFYLDYFCQKGSDDKRTSAQLFQDWQVLGRIWTHPRVLKMSFDKSEKERKGSSESADEAKKLRNQKPITDFFKKTCVSSSSECTKHESEDEGSIKNFIHDKSSSSSLSLSSSASSDDENGEKKDKTKKKEKKDKKDKGSEKKDSPLLRALVMQPVDEINLISSEEEYGDKNEEVKELKENHNSDKNKGNEDKVNDSGIEELEKNDESNSAEGKIIETEIDDKKETKEDKNEEDKGEKKEEDKGEKKEENKKEESGKEKKNKVVELLDRRGAWWKHIIDPEHFEDINQSSKLVVLFSILRECEMIEDKVLVFSQSLFSLDLIEYFLKKVDKATEENRLDESLGNHAGCWQKGLDYFRLDGSSSSENRSSWCKSFNRDDNPRARLFLISTRAGGLGINLTGANRVVIFDASWNPSHDIQSIFRIYRFGQKKPCYIYRFVAHGTMEEKVYDRQVAKQLLSSRVVDEQQVQRHFSMSDLNELYRFTPPQPDADKPTPVLPKDRLMAELLTQHNDWIEKYHEHDSLLENIAEEELNEEERQLAWEDYENEKKRGFMPQPQGSQGGAVPNYSTMAIQIQQFRSSLQYKFPNATEKEISAMLETLMYDVTYNRLSKQQQGQQGIAGPSHQQQNLQVVNSYRDDQFTRMLKNMLQTNTQKGGENSQRSAPNSIQMSQQRTGNQGRVGINQMNQQRTGNQARVVPNQMNHQRTGNTARLAPNQMNQQRTGNPIRVDIDINQLIQQRTGNQARRAPNQMNQQRIGNQARVPPNKMNQQRTGNQGRVAPNQQSLGFRPANQQMIGNGQIRKTHKTSQETYRDEMRRQQEANFARLRNQRRFQTPTTQQSTGTIGQQPIQNGNSNQPPIISRVRDNNGLQRTVNRQPNRTQTQQVQNQWKSMQTLNNRTNQPAVTSNRLQQMQNKQEAAINRLNSQQERRAAQRVAAEQSITQKKNQREVAAAQLKTQKQYQKDRFQQQIQQKQQMRQQTHQQNTQPKKDGSVDPVQRQLEDMKKRYKATRSTTSKPISIVEIDDEPGT